MSCAHILSLIRCVSSRQSVCVPAVPHGTDCLVGGNAHSLASALGTFHIIHELSRRMAARGAEKRRTRCSVNGLFCESCCTFVPFLYSCIIKS